MNAGIQGLAADIFKVALVRIDEALEARGVETRLVLQVHDEVLVEVPEDEREVVGPLVVDIMRHAADLDVPLEVNVAWGTRWVRSLLEDSIGSLSCLAAAGAAGPKRPTSA